MIKISDVSKELGISLATITKHYELGNIPKPKVNYKGWRYYNKEDIDVIKDFFNKVTPESEKSEQTQA